MVTPCVDFIKNVGLRRKEKKFNEFKTKKGKFGVPEYEGEMSAGNIQKEDFKVFKKKSKELMQKYDYEF